LATDVKWDFTRDSRKVGFSVSASAQTATQTGKLPRTPFQGTSWALYNLLDANVGYNSDFRSQGGNKRALRMNDYSHDAGVSQDGISKYLLAAIIALALLALPASRFQDAFKVLTWTAIVFGVYTPYVWPHLFDMRSRAVFALLCVAHISIVFGMYTRIPHEGFTSLGIAAIAELILFSIPGGWIVVHSRTHLDKAKGQKDAE
jgi:hypothetical protein